MKLLIKISALLLIVGITVSLVFGLLAREQLEAEVGLVEKTFTYDASSYTKIHVDVQNNPVKVLKSTDDEIKISLKHRDYEEVEDLSNETEIFIRITSNWWDQFINGMTMFNIAEAFQDKIVYIYVPDKLMNYEIRTSNGTISMIDLNATNVFLKTSNGNIELENVNLSVGSLTTSNGSIKIETVSAHKLEGSTSNGSVYIRNTQTDEVKLSTSNGPVTVINLSSAATEMKSSNGSVKMSIVGHFSDYKVQTSTSNGKVEINSQTYGNDTYNESRNPYVKATTSNGNIEVVFTLD